MSDSVLRSLERAVLETPTDEALLERLAYERVRNGLGWHGEKLPEADCGCLLRAVVDERGVYALNLHPAGGALVSLRLVYVPGGEVACERCSGRGDWPFTVTRPDGRGTLSSGDCPDCQPKRGARGTGRVKIVSHYTGRFPVTWGEYLAFGLATNHGHRYPDSVPRDPDGTFASRGAHPVVNVTHEDALAFCGWAGVRLPTAQEWRYAALGTTAEGKSREPWIDRSVPGYEMPVCVPRRFPWGNEPPSPERCAAADPRYSGKSTAPVVEWICPHPEGREGFLKPRPGLCVAPPATLEAPAHAHTPRCRLVPARPLGASWCGAQDMAGNVWQWVAEGSAHGGSFRNEIDRTPSPTMWSALGRWDHRQDPRSTSADDVGFRIALSGAP